MSIATLVIQKFNAVIVMVAYYFDADEFIHCRLKANANLPRPSDPNFSTSAENSRHWEFPDKHIANDDMFEGSLCESITEWHRAFLS